MRTRTVDGKVIIRKDTGKICKPRKLSVCLCKYCGESFLCYTKHAFNCGRKECRLAAKREYNNLSKIKKFGELGYRKKRCVVCGKEFKPTNSTSKYCSVYCSNVVLRKKKNEKQKKYQMEHKNDINFIFKKKLRRWIERCISGKKAKSSRMYVSYTPEEFKKHIEGLFYDGMSWENYGKWHIDHIRPLCSFDFVDKNGKINEREVARANSLENLQPLWAKENLSKNKRWK